MTNGEKIQEILSDFNFEEFGDTISGELYTSYCKVQFDRKWWNAEYKEPTAKSNLGADCISRADLYNEIKGIDHYEETEGNESDGSLITYHTCDWNEVLRTIEDAPSVTLQPTNNDSGAEYISREELMVILSDYYDTTPEYRSMLKEIASLSSITLTLQEPKSDWEQDHAILKAHSDGANEVLDKIRAEIEDLIDCPYDKCKGSDCIFCLQDECTVRGYRLMEILDKYNVETENT